MRVVFALMAVPAITWFSGSKEKPRLRASSKLLLLFKKLKHAPAHCFADPHVDFGILIVVETLVPR